MGLQMVFSSNFLALAAMVFGVMSAVAAGSSAFQAGREMDAAVNKARAESRSEVASVKVAVGARRLTQTQRDTIIRLLSGRTRASFVVVGIPEDHESMSYAFEIANALEAAGMKRHEGFFPIMPENFSSAPRTPISMYVPATLDHADLNDPDLLWMAFSKTFGPLPRFAFVLDNGARVQPDYYYIHVGRPAVPTFN